MKYVEKFGDRPPGAQGGGLPRTLSNLYSTNGCSIKIYKM
jgi:hypothetical protein